VAKQAEIDKIEAHAVLHEKRRQDTRKTTCLNAVASSGFASREEAVDAAEESAMAETRTPGARPLSPHLQVYRFTLLMASSILHRVTGAALAVGTLLLAWWLVALACGPAAYAWFAWFIGSPIGLVILFGYTWALCHHMMGGIRHLIWDTGASLATPQAKRLAGGGLAAGLLMTLALWGAAMFVVAHGLRQGVGG
jgi:succinate dehydrogenase / fumarate reductase cytochrome b subunit